jgi:hypothetical protein
MGVDDSDEDAPLIRRPVKKEPQPAAAAKAASPPEKNKSPERREKKVRVRTHRPECPPQTLRSTYRLVC